MAGCNCGRTEPHATKEICDSWRSFGAWVREQAERAGFGDNLAAWANTVDALALYATRNKGAE